MLDKLKLFDFTNEYQIHELIFVNSGSNYYVRLPVDMHAALISDNNSGKTSSLSALKLFLLPETSFKKQKDKFGFRSGGEYYPNLSSYTYYFPSTESYIICNASNPKGRFCWVLYRTTDLSYERIAVPKDYQAIEHLFWNSASDKNEKAGKLNDQITISNIKRSLTKDYGGKVFTDRKSIGEAIYTRTSATKEDSHFCLLPMARGFSSSITETIRSLLNIAFSLSDASTTSLPMAIGAILDSAGMSAVKKGADEGIFLDLDSQLHEWQELKQLDSHLQLVASHKNTWDALQEARREFGKLKGRCTDHFQQICWSLHSNKQELLKQQDSKKEEVSRSEQARQVHQPTYRRIANDYQDTKSTIKSTKNRLSEINDSIDRANFVRSRLRPLCVDGNEGDIDIINILNDQIEDVKAEIAGLEDEGKNLELMQALNSSIKANETTREKALTTINELESCATLLDNLTDESATILNSLNGDFAKLSLTTSNQQRNVIDDFTALFSQAEGKLAFCQAPLTSTSYTPPDKQHLLAKLRQEVEELTGIINNDKKKLSRLHKNSNLSKDSQRLKLQDSKQELGDMVAEIDALSAANMLATQHTNAINTLQQAEEGFEQLAAEKQAASDTLDQLTHNYNLARDELAQYTTLLQAVDTQRYQLNRIEAQSQGMLDWDNSILKFDIERTQIFSAEQLKTTLKVLQQELDAALLQRADCHRTMAMLLHHGIIDSSPEERHQITQNVTAFEQHFADLQTVYLNLDKSLEDYHERLAHHNNTAATASRMIENVHGIVSNFVKGINDELKGYQISNLTSVELMAELHPQYTDMIKTLNQIGSRTDQLLPETFYQQISNFQDQFYIKNPGKIDIAKIIEKISYRFERNNDAEDTPQSNGTNSMLNSVLLALLLKRLVPEDLSLSVPVVFDEVGSLDESNLRQVLKVMEDHRMYLFAANPEQNGVIASVLDVFHNLSVFKASDVAVVGKAEAIYIPGMEERLEDDIE